MTRAWQELAGSPRQAAEAVLAVIAAGGNRLWDPSAWFRHPEEASVSGWLVSGRRYPASEWLAAVDDDGATRLTACTGAWAVLLSAPDGAWARPFSLELDDGTSVDVAECALRVLALRADAEEDIYLLAAGCRREDVIEALQAIRDGRRVSSTAGYRAWHARRWPARQVTGQGE